MKIKMSEKTSLQTTSLFMQIIFVFFSVFFGIYVYEIAQDLNLVMAYTLFQSFVAFLTELVLKRFMNNKTLKIIYRLSFVMAFISTLLTFTINKNTLYMVFVTQFFYGITHTFYYTPFEIATMDKNNSGQMKKFIGISAFLSLMAGVLSPFLSGFIIEYVSYYVLLGIILICTIICLVLSFNNKKIASIDCKMNMKVYIKNVHSYKFMRYNLLGYGLFKFSQDGLIDLLLPILIFMRTGGNFSVGVYSSLATLIAGVILLIYISLVKNKEVAMWVSTIVLTAVSVMLVVWNSIISFFIYYFIKKISREILKNGIFEDIFTYTNNTPLQPYRVEQHLTFTIYKISFITASYIIAFLVYNFLNSAISMSIIILILTLFQFLSTYFVLKYEKLKKIELDNINITGENLCKEKQE